MVSKGIDMNATIQERVLPLYNRADLRHVGTKVAEKISASQLYKKICPKVEKCKHADINKAIYDKSLKEMHVPFLARMNRGGQK